MDLIAEAEIGAAIARAQAKPCEFCGAGTQDDTIVNEDGSIDHVCRLCHDTQKLTHRRMVLHCFNRVLEALRKLK